MNLTILRRIVIGVMLLAGVIFGVFVGDLRWQDARGGTSVQQVYAEFPDGSVQYGPYCTQNGTKLEGGGICRVVEHVTAYKRADAIFESILTGALAGGALGFMGVGAARWAFGRIEVKRRTRQRLAVSL